ncbi:hypothetical protein [Burkholderia pseudomultivorans]|uniref:hypothetical protein n=1 Tax=Burkholderia pseudomultivorans TaxID=1207504 RepID=UPI00188F6124|nr:hypothetical protein [Burkholderia pseudomultivorans]MBF5008692.1 hypothetical protein [Burkholderia pseudomultivorans]
MKARIATCVVSALLLVTANTYANEAHHPEAAPQKSATVSKKVVPGQSDQSAERFENARRQMQKMLAQMDAIRETKDPAERQRLMDEHMRTMQDAIQSMHAMGGPMMMNMMGPQGMGGGGSEAQSGNRGSMGARMDMMEKRMDMMQMMMEQMLQQQMPAK